MPKRTTLNFSSSDSTVPVEQLHVYYCRYSGKHVLSTDCDLSKAPRRRTDGAIVLDSEFYTAKLYTADGGVKLIKRKSGAVERQLRLNSGKLPIGYRSEPGGRFLYILKDAVSEYSGQPEAGKTGRKPVPPCIVRVSPEAVQVTLEVITVDSINTQVRLGQLSIVRGESTRQKLLLVQGLSPDAVFEKLESSL